MFVVEKVHYIILSFTFTFLHFPNPAHLCSYSFSLFQLPPPWPVQFPFNPDSPYLLLLKFLYSYFPSLLIFIFTWPQALPTPSTNTHIPLSIPPLSLAPSIKTWQWSLKGMKTHITRFYSYNNHRFSFQFWQGALLHGASSSIRFLHGPSPATFVSMFRSLDLWLSTNFSCFWTATCIYR